MIKFSVEIDVEIKAQLEEATNVKELFDILNEHYILEKPKSKFILGIVIGQLENFLTVLRAKKRA